MSKQTGRANIEVYAIVDADGDYAVGKTAEEAATSYEENIQALCDAGATRLVKVTLAVALPRPIELTGVVGEDMADAELVSAN